MATVKLANAPCSWGVLEFDLEAGSRGYPQVLDEMARAGYAGTELGDWGFLPTDPAELRAVIAQRNLGLMAGFVPVALTDPSKHAAGLEVALKTARLLREANPAPFIVLADENGSIPVRTQNAGRIRPEHGLDDAGFRTAAEAANHIARAVLDATGVRTVFHHHCAGYVETPAEIDRFLALTDPQLVSLCLDTGHYTFGGGNAVEGLRKHFGRIAHVHFKDCEPKVAQQARDQGWDYFEAVRRGVFCELGRGSVDFATILGELRSRGYDGWIVVEQDVLPGMGSPFESAKRNREYLRALGL